MSDDWMKRAACTGMDPKIFFPDVGSPDAYDKAKEICEQCPVQQECTESKSMRDTGMWGGTYERKLIHSGLPNKIDGRSPHAN